MTISLQGLIKLLILYNYERLKEREKNPDRVDYTENLRREAHKIFTEQLSYRPFLFILSRLIDINHMLLMRLL